MDTEQAVAVGAELRKAVPHGDHAAVTLPAGRPTIESFVRARDADRLPELARLGHARMAASAFGFFRGSAGLMAHDLARDPVTGLNAQLCGDAHVANFGLYGTPDGRIVMDINDFDETVVGPFEWDLKRLAASVVLAGRTGVQVGDEATAKAARHAARAYRDAIENLAGQPFLASWTALGDESAIARAKAGALFDDFAKAASKAARQTNQSVAAKITHQRTAGWHFNPEPPVLTAVDEQTRTRVIDSLAGYRTTLHESRRHLFGRYRPHDVAMRVVGTGSVGTRVYLVLLQGAGEEALILQVKQAQPSALAPYLPPVPAEHHGARIVHGTRLVQAETDILLGWTTIEDRHYTVRQFRNRKGAIDATLLARDHLDDYARLAGALLARAHSRFIDPRVLHGYLRDGRDFDEAISRHALGYADQAELDHAEFVALIDSGRVDASPDPDR